MPFTPDLVKAVVDELFAQLEVRFANRPLILVALHGAQAVADSLIPVVFAKLQAKK